MQNQMLSSVYIMGGLRTPIGSYKGQFKHIRPEQLGARLLDVLHERYASVDEIICGNAVGTGGNIGRLTALYSAYGKSVPAYTVDMQCASAGAAIIQGYRAIRSKMANTVIAGGVESSSLQPLRTYASDDERQGSYMVAQFSPHENDALAMLQGAERTAQKYDVKKEELDYWSLRSHRLAVKAREEGIVSPYIFDMGAGYKDESIKPRLQQKILDRMKPILGEGTVTTAGNACYTHDGAAFVVLSEEPGPFRIVGALQYGGDPLYSPEGAWQATEQLLERTGLRMADLDAIEWNEAFAVIDVLFARTYGAYEGQYNQLGGALAYGHPFGCSGAIILLHAMAALEYRQGRYGICAIAGAGGMGTAILIERLV
ncbi:acetyl-CoA C-acyltransferase [Veillonella intestinalis]|uniref:acetyl-CoA C-acyltransferase n=1 Tax=Veillonella intestinalis TaxID=2941341 RepID=UPI002040BF04|nr:acetyl-CoA C-acyltransferase [Veillonella intestinalis]